MLVLCYRNVRFQKDREGAAQCPFSSQRKRVGGSVKESLLDRKSTQIL